MIFSEAQFNSYSERLDNIGDFKEESILNSTPHEIIKAQEDDTSDINNDFYEIKPNTGDDLEETSILASKMSEQAPDVIDDKPQDFGDNKYMPSRQLSDETPSASNKLKVDISNLHPISVKILYELTKFITSNPSSNIFAEHVFPQPIQVRNQQKEVFLINSEDFFETLEIYGIITNPINKYHKLQLEQCKDELEELL